MFECWFVFQEYIIFNPNDRTQLLSNSETQVLFYSSVSPAVPFLLKYIIQLLCVLH